MAPDNRVVDEDTARAINTGRAAMGSALRTAQTHLQKVFIFFVVGLIGTIYALRLYIWPKLKEDLLARDLGAEVIAQTPFDVILLQVKIGLVIGILMIIPPLVYYGRRPLMARGLYPERGLAQLRFVGIGLLAVLLFIGGISYAYGLFFPIMFRFLATFAESAGLASTYSIVDWTEFIFILALSFGLAAELPLAMSGLAYTGIVPYETFRDRWKYAVVAIFTFGALFSPPEPFTQILWAAPLLVLYGASLGLTKLVVMTRRSSDNVDVRAVARGRWLVLSGSAVVAAGLTFGFFEIVGVELVNDAVLPLLPANYRPAPLSSVEPLVVALLSAAVGLVVALALLGRYVFQRLSELEEMGAVHNPRAKVGDPAAIDLDGLDAAGVRAAPPEAFAELTEKEALGHAREAMEADDPEKAQAILDRFDEAQEAHEDEVDSEVADDADAEESLETGDVSPSADYDGDNAGDDAGGSGNVVQDTATGVVNAFTEDETTEDDIGGYYYDIAFIFDSLTSKMFYIVGLFGLVLAGTFMALQQGGLAILTSDFLSRIPPEIRPDPNAINWPVTLHPVEALVFEVKVSTLLAVIAILPMLFYYAWPALEERGFVTGNRNALYLWAVTLFVGLIGGSVVGYMFVAPNIISYLVQDALQANMIIAYRVKTFFWLIILTTVGIGMLANVPITMVLFNRAGIVSYGGFRKRWRGVAIGVFAVSALVTPDTVYTMFIIAIPFMLMYGVGLAILWPTTLPGRRRRGKSEPAETV